MATREFDPDDDPQAGRTRPAADAGGWQDRRPRLIADNAPALSGSAADRAGSGADAAGSEATPAFASPSASASSAGTTRSSEPGTAAPSWTAPPFREAGSGATAGRSRPAFSAGLSHHDMRGPEGEAPAPAPTHPSAADPLGARPDATESHAPPLLSDPPLSVPRSLEWPAWIAAGVSVFWLAFFAFYVHQSVGWSNLFMLLPHEFAGFAAGALVPVALAWALVAVFSRDGRYGREAVILRDQLRKLAYPTDTARGQMNDVARSLTEQARLLTDSSRQALAEARQVRDGLRNEVVALSALADKFREDITQVIRDTESQVYGLEDATERAVSRARDAGQTLERQSSTLSEAAEKMLTQTRTLDESLRKHVQDLTLVGQQAREHGSGIRAVNDSITRSLADGRTLGEQLSGLLREIDDHLGGQQDRLEDLRARWEKTGTGVVESLTQRTQGIDTLSERLLSRTQVIETTIGRQTDALLSASDQSMSRLKEMEGLFTRRVQSMNAVVDEATEKLSDASMMVAQRGQEAAGATGTATETLERAASTLDDMLRTLANAVQRAESRARDAGAAVKDQAETLEEHTAEASRQAGFIREAIAAQTAELGEGARLIGHQLELVQSALTQQARYLGEAAQTASGRIEDTVEGLRQRLGELSGLSGQVNTELEGVGSKLDEHARMLESTSAHAVAHTREATNAVREETETLRALAFRIHESLEGLEETLAARNLAISRAAEAADQRLSDTAGTLDGKVRLLSDTADQARTALGDVASALESRAGQMEGVVTRAVGRMSEMGTALEQHARQFEDITGRGLSQATVAGNRLRQSTDGLQAAADKAAETVRGAASLLGGAMEEADESARALVPALEKSVAGIRQEVDSMTLTGEKLSETTRRLGAEFGRNAQTLLDAADKAEARAASLRTEMDRAEVTNFLHQASFMIERLESVAVDIARIFNPVRDEELWRRYQKGDHGVFLRHLARVMTVKQHGAVREVFDGDREFRGYVTQFVTDYESLLEQVRQTARADILTALFIGSDLGKVYLVLAKALGRLEE